MISKLTASGYRLLHGCEADLGQLTVVIGANASGKSTLLDCLQLASQLMDWPVNQVMNWHGGYPSLLSAAQPADRLSIELAFARPRTISMWSQVPLPEDQSFEYQIAFSGDRYGQAVPDLEVLRGADGTPGAYLEATRSLIDLQRGASPSDLL